MNHTMSISPSGCHVALKDPGLWEKFWPNTEMKVTRKSGRKLFPDLEYEIKGLVPDALYSIWLHLERCDGFKYKFISEGNWDPCFKGDTPFPIDKKQHSEGIQKGSHWMDKPVSFDYIRLSNNPDNKENPTILVQSMHKYQPVITVEKLENGQREEFRLKITEFMVVTAYNSSVQIELKKTLNKMASGFRVEGGHTRRNEAGTPRGRKRKASSTTVSPDTVPHSQTPPTFNYPNSFMLTPPTPATPSALSNSSGSYQFQDRSLVTPPTFGSQIFGATPSPNSYMMAPKSLTPPSFNSRSFEPTNDYMMAPQGLTPPPQAPPTFDNANQFNFYPPYNTWNWNQNVPNGGVANNMMNEQWNFDPQLGTWNNDGNKENLGQYQRL